MSPGTAGDRRLTRERIVATALRLIEEHGVEGVSMRGLARALGVPPMSLYRHVESKEQLREYIVVELLAQQAVTAEPADDWEGALRELARTVRSLARSHPVAFGLLAGVPPDDLLADRLVLVDLLLALAYSGVPPDQAKEHLAVAISIIAGYCLMDVSRIRGGDPAASEEGPPGLLAPRDPTGDRAFDLVIEIVLQSLRGRMEDGPWPG